jgi:hypothetical protein
MKLFSSITCFLLFLAISTLPQSFASEINTKTSLQGNEPYSGKETGLLQWKSLGEKTTYQFQMARDSEFQQILLDKKCEKPEISFTPPDVSGIYYIRIRPIDSSGNEGKFLPVQIYEIRDRLNPPFIIAPEELSEVRDVFDIDIVWRSVPDAAGYHVMIARDRAFKNIIFDNAKITTTSYRIRNLDFGTHFLKISAIAGDGREGPFSESRYFMIVPHPVTAPQNN